MRDCFGFLLLLLCLVALLAAQRVSHRASDQTNISVHTFTGVLLVAFVVRFVSVCTGSHLFLKTGQQYDDRQFGMNLFAGGTVDMAPDTERERERECVCVCVC